MQNYTDKRNNVRKSLPKLAFWGLLLIALVPYGWATQYSSKAHYLFNHLLSGELTHFLGHFLLFVLMGTAVLIIFPRLKNYPPFYFGLILFIGFLQEFLQLVTFKMHPFSFAEVFDLATDLFGAALAFWVIRRLNRKGTIRN